jgi:hypothetical protein
MGNSGDSVRVSSETQIIFLKLVHTNEAIREKLHRLKGTTDSSSLLRSVVSDIKRAASTEFGVKLSPKEIVNCIKASSMGSLGSHLEAAPN